MAISIEQIQEYFDQDNTGKMKDLTKLSGGGYSNYYTQLEFMQFRKGFYCAVNHFGGG